MPEMDSARDAYDRYAAVYDEFNAQNDYELWLGEALLPELEKDGLRKGWALDVGCGTGRAFEPLLRREWQIVGCDISPAMLEEARRKYGSRVSLLSLDGRNLPPIRPSSASRSGNAFQLILLLNDVVNYMTEDGDLESAFAGVRRNLSPDQGLVVFDINTLSLFRAAFASGVSAAMSTRGVEWRGLDDRVRPGATYRAQLSAPGVETHVHRQRHWTIEQVKKSLNATGLCCLATLGQREEDNRILFSESPDEERDYKIIFIASCDQVEHEEVS